MRGGKGPGRPSLVRCRRVIALRQFDYDASSAESWCSPWLIDCRQRARPAMPRSVTRLTRLLSACRHPGPGRGAAPRSRGASLHLTGSLVEEGRPPSCLARLLQVPRGRGGQELGREYPRWVAQSPRHGLERGGSRPRCLRRSGQPHQRPARLRRHLRMVLASCAHSPGDTHTTENAVMCDGESHGNRNRRLELRRDCVRSRQPFRVTQRDAGIVVWTF